MKHEILRILVCPKCKDELSLKIIEIANDEIKNGKLICSCGMSYPIINYVPRFVSTDKYVGNFSFEWNKYKITQFDSYTGNKETEKTFENKIGFDLSRIKGKSVLDVGCGSGRFLELFKESGANIVGIDLSYAVDSANDNLGLNKNVNIIQADVFNLPFKDETFDFIYSIGVLHHTIDTEKAFKCLPRVLKYGGEIGIWVYSNEGFFTRIYNKISEFYRIFTTRLSQQTIHELSNYMANFYNLKAAKIPYRVICFILPQSGHPSRECRVLENFDWYTPKYQYKHTYGEVIRWFHDMGIYDLTLLEKVSVKGRKVLR